MATDLENLIEKLVKKGDDQLDKKELSLLKQCCKSESNNNEFYLHLYHLIRHQLKQKHSQIRFSSFLLIDYLFQRSHLFRSILCRNLIEIIEYCLHVKLKNDKSQSTIQIIELQQSDILRPITWTKKLREKFFERFRCWQNEFGQSYPCLKYHYDLLIEKKLIKLNENQSTSGWQREIPEETLEKLKTDFNEFENDLNTLIMQIDSCFELLIPKMNLIEDHNDNDSSENEFRPMQGLSFNIILQSKIEILRDESNSILIENLKELCNELKKYYEKLKNFQTQSKFANNILNDKIEKVRIKIAVILSKENDIKIIGDEQQNIDDDNDDDDDDDDDFEEVTESEDKILLAKIEEKEKQEQSSNNDHHSNQIQQCRALLPSGRLCPRRDLENCPFHGKIISRDSEGLPIDEELKKIELEKKFERESNQWKDPKYLRQLSEQIGKDLTSRALKRLNSKTNLIDLKQLKSTPRQRLKSKLKLNKRNNLII